MRDIHIITGQTACGKTSHALRLAQENGGELISADSRQVYQKLDIITGKDVPHDTFVKVGKLRLERDRVADIGYYEINGTKIWGLDLVDPKIPFSSYDFTVVCEHLFSKHIHPNKCIYLVGGSWLYIKHLVYGFGIAVSPQWKLREELAHYSVEQLQNRLIDIDKPTFEALNNSDRNNPHRLIRKIEIASSKKHSTNTSITTPKVKVISLTGFKFAQTKKMEEVITQRVHARLEQGAIQEVESLLKGGYSRNNPGLKTIGYQQIISFLSGDITRDQAVDQWIRAEMHYAKRQYTFMKKDTHITWAKQ